MENYEVDMKEWFKKISRIKDAYLANGNYKRLGFNEQPSFAFEYDGISTSISLFNRSNYADIILKPLRDYLGALDLGIHQCCAGVTVNHIVAHDHHVYLIDICDYAAIDERSHFISVTVYKDRGATQMIYDMLNSSPASGETLYFIYEALDLKAKSMEYYMQ